MKKKLILTIFLLSGAVINADHKAGHKAAAAAAGDDIVVAGVLPETGMELDNDTIGLIIGALFADIEFMELLQSLASKFTDTVEANTTPEKREAFGKAHPKAKALYKVVKLAAKKK